ncbi:AIPR protein [Vogesella indigofera]|uniref:AIPR protein n=1 Tax=Vogesella indigofera TaxID=45465 RepID=A0A495BCA2_VOGIN|nr:AIPR family protein [Vogesella indigofera]RKQ57834.1 AIPR protein [Vogesella indigofera]
MNQEEFKNSLLGALEDSRLDDFRRDMLEMVKANAVANSDFEQSAFVTEAARQLEDAEEISDFVQCYFEDPNPTGRKRMRIDGYALDEVDGSYRLLVAEYHGDGAPLTPTLNKKDVEQSFKSLRNFVEQALAGVLHSTMEESHPACALASDIYHKAEHISRFRLYLVTDAEIRLRKKDWPEENCGNIPVEFHLWDIARFQRVNESLSGQDELEVDFTEYLPDGIPCLAASQMADNCQSYLCVIPGDVLAGIYDRFGSRLLEGNVRSFLSTRGKVNKGIQTTIKNEPEMFFAFNNGISATTTGAEVRIGANGMHLVAARYLQIVNGGQTTASLSTAKRSGANLAQTHVQMKLTVIEPDQSQNIVPRIAQYANSQNKVSDADFFSNHPFHVRIENLSRRLWTPPSQGEQHGTHWFYERARGQYLNEQSRLTVAQKKAFVSQNPRERMFSKTDLAKYENSWEQLPHKVSLGAQKNFIEYAKRISEQWQHDADSYNEDYYRNAIAKAILFRKTERIVSQQEWYKDYRAQIVTYSIAKLAEMIKSQTSWKTLDFKVIWNRQDITPALELQITRIAGRINEIICRSENQARNISEWCKKEACWQQVKEEKLPFYQEFFNELADTIQVNKQAREARDIQKMDGGIDAQITVVNLGSAYWNKIQIWGKKNLLLGETDNKLISTAIKGVPNEKQSRKLIELRARLIEEGFNAD